MAKLGIVVYTGASNTEKALQRLLWTLDASCMRDELRRYYNNIWFWCGYVMKLDSDLA